MPSGIEVAAVPLMIIRPSRSWTMPQLAELWEHRELLYFLVWRDIKVRYKQTALGAIWAVLQPFATMVVFSVFFGRLAKVPSDGVPYPVFAYCALVPWQLFSCSLTESSNSLVQNQQLLTKIYFPRLMIPIAPVLAALVDTGIAFVLLLGMMWWYGITPGTPLLLLPMFVLLAVVTALAAGLWLSALNVEYRDVRYTIPFLTQFWLFLTPIAYPASLVPPRWRVLYGLNPMVGVVEAFRWALLGTPRPPWSLLVASLAAVVPVLFGGLLFFRRMERTFADVV